MKPYINSRYTVVIAALAALFMRTAAEAESAVAEKTDCTVVQGEITVRSALPDPAASDYPDCRFSAQFSGFSILEGAPCPRDIALVLDGFKNFRNTAFNEFKAGDKVKLKITPFESLPDAMKQQQQADDLQLFELENYYVLDGGKIDRYEENQLRTDTVPFAETGEKYIPLTERKLNPPITDEAAAEQQKCIKGDLEKITARLNTYENPKTRTQLNQKFASALKAEADRDKPGFNRTDNGNSLWRRKGKSYWKLPLSKQLLPTKIPQITENNMKALLALRDICEANGVQFILSVVPNSSDIAARVILPEFAPVPDRTAWTAKQLLEAGIGTIYATPEIVADHDRYMFAYEFPLDGHHPADTVQDILTGIAAERLQRFHFPPMLDRGKFSFPVLESKNKSWKNLPENCDTGDLPAGSRPVYREVYYDGKPLPRDPGSPVMVIGNSYIRSPFGDASEQEHYAYPSLLAAKLGTGTDSFRKSSFSICTTFMQDLVNTPERFLKGKKVLIMQIGAGMINAEQPWSNPLEIERQRTMLRGRGKTAVFQPCAAVTEDEFYGLQLPDLHALRLAGNGRATIGEYDISRQTDAEKDAVCVIPVIYPSLKSNTDLKISVNGETQKIAPQSNHYVWMKYCFRLPAGTGSITIIAEGKPETGFAVGNIEVRQ